MTRGVAISKIPAQRDNPVSGCVRTTYFCSVLASQPFPPAVSALTVLLERPANRRLGALVAVAFDAEALRASRLLLLYACQDIARRLIMPT
jgi:hypothetical protein